MRHSLLMLLGCLLPLVAIFFLPLWNQRGVALFVFLILMFGCHLMVMRGCHHRHTKQTGDSHEQT
jgi:Flp pilus assembly protein TadB